MLNFSRIRHRADSGIRRHGTCHDPALTGGRIRRGPPLRWGRRWRNYKARKCQNRTSKMNMSCVIPSFDGAIDKYVVKSERLTVSQTKGGQNVNATSSSMMSTSAPSTSTILFDVLHRSVPKSSKKTFPPSVHLVDLFMGITVWGTLLLLVCQQERMQGV